MSEEELIEYLKEDIRYNEQEHNLHTDMWVSFEKEILNLIDKLQKEVKGFKKENKRLKEQVEEEIHARDCVAHCSVSKNKIREKIKELEEGLIENYGELGESLTTNEIKTLKKLLEEE